MVSGAFAKLPQSSEQILHPEKYFAYEAPVKVTLPDLTDLLNEHRKQANSKQQTADSKQQKAATETAHSIARGSSAKNPTPDTRYPTPSKVETRGHTTSMVNGATT